MDAETKADLRVKVRRRVSEYIKKSGLPLNRTGSGETEAVCPNCGQTAAVKKIPLEEHFEFWKCDSCGAEGDAVQYAMHHLRTASEDEALLDVCKKLGVAIPFLPTITARELMEREFPPRVELIEGMLGPGLYILAGAPKIGKSWLVLQIAHHISTGTPLWDRRVSRHAVLYLCLEDTLQRIQSRLLTICDGETGDVTFSIEAGLLGDGFEGQLTAYLRGHADTKMVIVDTLAKVRGVVSSSNVYSSDYAAMNVLKHLADTFKIALILVHHTRKQDAEDAMQKISGTNGLMGCADGAMVLEKPDRSAPQAILTMTGRDFEDQTFYLRQNRETMRWEIADGGEEFHMAPAEPVMAAVAALVQEEGTWKGTAMELVEVLQNRDPELNVRPNTLSRKLRTAQLQEDFGIRLIQSRNQNGKYLELKSMTDMSDGGG